MTPTPSLENRRLHRIDYMSNLPNESIFDMNSTNANNGFIDKITLGIYEVNYFLNGVIGNKIYKPINNTINFPGQLVGNTVTNVMDYVHDNFIEN